ncbi:patatin-like phospholipase family protein [Haliangium ochraceum]|uniref:Patatin n=1 Tax=Haliangium ochraceum (strain DSM 14365 / JCM 11303 / SMP-2) TaxID=502025 RepID=D0LVF3_HALO1|nr:patatin-like phospholipase family protein [Haliangium ochraceum]ACY17514.1 Patatin [Haliangium ochraceum DSM 14365]
MKTRKIALVLAGGVSLGSYEAGVLAELLYALDWLNRPETLDGRDPFELDIMTGASAGGMTAALVARIMMYDLPGRRDHLRRVWVDGVDIVGLLDQQDVPLNALLSKRVLAQLAHDYVVKGSDAPPIAPASFAPERLHLSLTLSNMHGISYEIPYFASTDSESQFVTTMFSDMANFTLERADLPGRRVWDTIVQSALACGSFPFAFQPHPLRRSSSDYRGSMQEHDTALFDRDMMFIDGGMFNNEPLGEAIDTASDVDGGTIEPDRIFLLVDPNINASNHVSEILLDDSITKHALRMGQMLLGESTAREWLRANRTNVDIEWRDHLVSQVGRMLREAELADAAAMAAAMKALASEIVARRRALLGADEVPDSYLESRSARTMKGEPFAALYASLGASSGEDGGAQPTHKQELFRYLVFVLNTVSNLKNKQKIHLSLIGADKRQVAGDTLSGFGGFFEHSWRLHDYRVGRRNAHALLPTMLGVPAYAKEPGTHEGAHEDYHLPPEWADYPNITIEKASHARRIAFSEVVLARADTVMSEFGIPKPVRWVARTVFLKRWLAGKLGL